MLPGCRLHVNEERAWFRENGVTGSHYVIRLPAVKHKVNALGDQLFLFLGCSVLSHSSPPSQSANVCSLFRCRLCHSLSRQQNTESIRVVTSTLHNAHSQQCEVTPADSRQLSPSLEIVLCLGELLLPICIPFPEATHRQG